MGDVPLVKHMNKDSMVKDERISKLLQLQATIDTLTAEYAREVESVVADGGYAGMKVWNASGTRCVKFSTGLERSVDESAMAKAFPEAYAMIKGNVVKAAMEKAADAPVTVSSVGKVLTDAELDSICVKRMKRVTMTEVKA